jgi:hypothetical protein
MKTPEKYEGEPWKKPRYTYGCSARRAEEEEECNNVTYFN